MKQVEAKIKPIVVTGLLICVFGVIYIWLSLILQKTAPVTLISAGDNSMLFSGMQTQLDSLKANLIAQRRQFRINKVETYFKAYGSPLSGYGYIFVDQAERCGGNYRVLVGIAGSESGLGRINYKTFNPFGYLNNVQYTSYEQALTDLACKISRQHIAVCGTDLDCLARRYIGGGGDDPDLFISKVRFFMNQV
jgi:hypothetical protein